MQSDISAPAGHKRERGVYTSEIRLELLKAVLKKGKLFRFQAPGFSMYPFIKNNDIITVAPPAIRRPGTGDIVAYVHPEIEKLIVHRVIQCSDNAFLIKGDNTSIPDGLVPRENIFGTVIRVERAGRNAVAGLSYGRKAIALMSRYGILQGCTRMMRFPQKAGVAGLHQAQKFAIYRRFARNLRPDLAILKADEKDMNVVQAQWDLVTEPEPEPYRRNPEVTNIVAKHDNTILGFIQLIRHPDTSDPYTGCWLFSLNVKTPYRGMGIGRELVMNVIEMAQQDGADGLSLLVSEKNQPAIALFSDLLFKPATSPELEMRLKEEYAATGTRQIALHRVF